MIVWGLHLCCMPALCLNGVNLLQGSCVRSIHCMSLLHGWGIQQGAVVGGRGKPSFPPSNFCVRATNDHKSAAFTVFCGPTLSSRQIETKGWWDDEVPSSAGQVFPPSPGSRGVHLPTTNPLWWIDEAVTDSALQKLYLGLEHRGPDWNTLSSHKQ